MSEPIGTSAAGGRRLRWGPVVDRAAEFVSASSIVPTLRQVFYVLVSGGLIPNAESAYKRLSSLTAEARREDSFPRLLDQTRTLHRPRTFDSPADAQRFVAEIYRRDRTEGQAWQVILSVEKDTLRQQIVHGFERYGLPVVVLRGYGSQSYMDEITGLIDNDDRPSVVLHAGDFDPSGEDIDRDLQARVPCIDVFERVAITPDVISRFSLPPMFGKATDSRAAGFLARHGRLVQVEVEALRPDQLHRLFSDALGPYVDESLVDAVLDREKAEIADLRRGA